jgi:hypothetical protein
MVCHYGKAHAEIYEEMAVGGWCEKWVMIHVLRSQKPYDVRHEGERVVRKTASILSWHAESA